MPGEDRGPGGGTVAALAIWSKGGTEYRSEHHVPGFVHLSGGQVAARNAICVRAYGACCIESQNR